MNLTQLQENFEAIRLKGNRVETVEKAVELANVCQQVRKYETAIACLNKVLPDVQKDAGLHAVVKTALGTAYWEKAQLQKALNHFEEALALFEKAGDRMGKGVILSIVGITFWRKCDWDKALEILKDALRLNEEKKVEQRFASLYGAFERGIATLKNRVRMGRELQDSLKILQPLFSMCPLYWVIGDHEQFKVCLDESLVLAESLNNTDILNAAKDLKKMAN